MNKVLQLSTTLATLDEQLAKLAWPKNLPDSRIDLFVTTTAITAKAIELAKSIGILTRFDAGHLGGAALLRILLEVSNELDAGGLA
jgi:hypothetical protein